HVLTAHQRHGFLDALEVLRADALQIALCSRQRLVVAPALGAHHAAHALGQTLTTAGVALLQPHDGAGLDAARRDRLALQSRRQIAHRTRGAAHHRRDVGRDGIRPQLLRQLQQLLGAPNTSRFERAAQMRACDVGRRAVGHQSARDAPGSPACSAQTGAQTAADDAPEHTALHAPPDALALAYARDCAAGCTAGRAAGRSAEHAGAGAREHALPDVRADATGHGYPAREFEPERSGRVIPAQALDALPALPYGLAVAFAARHDRVSDAD